MPVVWIKSSNRRMDALSAKTKSGCMFGSGSSLWWFKLANASSNRRMDALSAKTKSGCMFGSGSSLWWFKLANARKTIWILFFYTVNCTTKHFRQNKLRLIRNFSHCLTSHLLFVFDRTLTACRLINHQVYLTKFLKTLIFRPRYLNFRAHSGNPAFPQLIIHLKAILLTIFVRGHISLVWPF